MVPFNVGLKMPSPSTSIFVCQETTLNNVYGKAVGEYITRTASFSDHISVILS